MILGDKQANLPIDNIQYFVYFSVALWKMGGHHGKHASRLDAEDDEASTLFDTHRAKLLWMGKALCALS